MRFVNKKRREAQKYNPTLEDLVNIFFECNKLYFNDELPEIPIETMNSEKDYGELEYRINSEQKRFDILKIKIDISHERTKKNYISTMIHEMIHYKIFKEIEQETIKRALWEKNNGNTQLFNELLYQENFAHSKDFIKIANNINKIYGLNIHLR